MSYCRFAWDGSDVYVYESARGLECCGCLLDDEFVTAEPEAMIVHLARHRREGHFVPARAIESLWANIPGAQRPPKGEPVSLTMWRVFGEKCRLENEFKRLQALEDRENATVEGVSEP